MINATVRKVRVILTNYLTRKLLKAVTVDEVLVISGREYLVGKRKLSPADVMDLKEEARSLVESDLYRLLEKELLYKATVQRFDQAATADDMLYGKAMLYCFDLMRKFIRNIAEL